MGLLTRCLDPKTKSPSVGINYLRPESGEGLTMSPRPLVRNSEKHSDTPVGWHMWGDPCIRGWENMRMIIELSQVHGVLLGFWWTQGYKSWKISPFGRNMFVWFILLKFGQVHLKGWIFQVFFANIEKATGTVTAWDISSLTLKALVVLIVIVSML